MLGQNCEMLQVLLAGECVPRLPDGPSLQRRRICGCGGSSVRLAALLRASEEVGRAVVRGAGSSCRRLCDEETAARLQGRAPIENGNTANVASFLEFLLDFLLLKLEMASLFCTPSQILMLKRRKQQLTAVNFVLLHEY